MKAKKKKCPTCGRERVLWSRRHGCIDCTNAAKGKSLGSGILKPISNKRKEQLKDYSVLRIEFLLSHPKCQAEASVHCTGTSTDVHHVRGSDNDRFLKFDDWMAVCRICHGYIHTHPEESYEKGWMKLKR